MFTLALCAVFLFSTRVVFSLQLSFTEAHQCEPFTFTIEGPLPQGQGRPTALSIIPFDSTPVVIPIPNPEAGNGSFTTILPYPAGTQFLASLEDGRGATVLPASQVLKVGQGEKDGSQSCVKANPSLVQHFTLLDKPAQCQEFSISYNTSAVPRPPQIRAYIPQGLSIPLNQTSADLITGTARYTMAVAAGMNVVLFIDGENGIRETTELFIGQWRSCVQGHFATHLFPSLVAGNSVSTDECLGSQAETELSPVGASKSPGISSRSVWR
jgi:hypothetical protein